MKNPAFQNAFQVSRNFANFVVFSASKKSATYFSILLSIPGHSDSPASTLKIAPRPQWLGLTCEDWIVRRISAGISLFLSEVGKIQASP
jgi:hypothetical protein